MVSTIKSSSMPERTFMTEDEEQQVVAELDEALLVAQLEEWLQK